MESLRETAMKILFTVAMLTLGCALLHAQSERSLLRDGNRSYKQNNFTDAEVNYRKALEKSKELTQGEFNLGDALYKQGRYAEAAEQYRNSAQKHLDEGTKAEALHNLGNALLKDKKIPESIAAYQDALKLNPRDMDTKYNLAYAQAMLRKEQQQQQQQKNQKNDKQQQNRQDQQKQDQQKQEQQKNQQQKDQKQEQQQAQQKKQQISKEDAERILEALRNEEKDVQKKLHKKVPARVKVEKDW